MLEPALRRAANEGATDIFIVAGAPVSLKVRGEIVPVTDVSLTPAVSESLVREIYRLAGREFAASTEYADDDFALSLPGVSRYRISAYKQRGSFAAVVRVIPFGIPDYKALNIPERVIRSVERRSGLIIVSGPAGSGKSTTLACMINYINETRSGHIITLEDPIEYLHRNKRCIVSQRETALDTADMSHALRASLRQAPDVIQIGEMRDFETITTALTAAETGHLVITTLHTRRASDAISRIIDVFPSERQPQIRTGLSMLLKTVISQQLVSGVGETVVPAFEICKITPAIRALIRESKLHQIDANIVSGASYGMCSMESSLTELYRRGLITSETAVSTAFNPEQLRLNC